MSKKKLVALKEPSQAEQLLLTLRELPDEEDEDEDE